MTRAIGEVTAETIVSPDYIVRYLAKRWILAVRAGDEDERRHFAAELESAYRLDRSTTVARFRLERRQAGPPISYSDQWQDSGTNISGAPASTYTPTDAPVFNTIDVVVTATAQRLTRLRQSSKH